MNWFLLPLSPHPHVILHAGFTRSCRIHCFQKRQNLLPRRRKDFEDDHPTHSGRGYFLGRWFLRLCLRLRAEWQVWEAYCSEWKSSCRRSRALGSLMLWTLAVDTKHIGCWCSVHWCWVIGCWQGVHWLLMFCTLAVDTVSIDVEDECIDVNVEFNVVDAVRIAW